MTPTIASVCLRDAISGTTPPNLRWKSTWLATTLESTSWPSRSTAAAVSSHDVSMARIRSLCVGDPGSAGGLSMVKRESAASDLARSSAASATASGAASSPVHMMTPSSPLSE
jgi:hypothetical protein